MDVREYINLATSKIVGKRDRYFVEQELMAHIDDRITYYTDAGYDYTVAEEKAMERMGDPKNIGDSISKLHNADRYRKISLYLNIAYIVGIAFGCAWTVYLLHSFDLENQGTAFFTCLFSIIWFGVMSFAYTYTHKSQDTKMLTLNGLLSIANLVISPLMYLPTFSTILSLPFEFPVEYASDYGGFGFFYYPLDRNIFEKFEPTADYASVFTIILWTLMATAVLVPLANAISSLKTAKRYAKFDYDGKDERRYTRVQRFSKLLIILTIISALFLSVEVAIVVNKQYVDNKNTELSYESDSEEAWRAFNALDLPASIDDACVVMGGNEEYVDWETLDICGELELVINNNFQVTAYAADDTEDIVFDIKTLVNNHSKITNDRIDKIYSTDFDSYDEFMDLVELDEISRYSENSNGDIQISMDSYIYKSLYYEFENGKLTFKECVDWEDIN